MTHLAPVRRAPVHCQSLATVQQKALSLTQRAGAAAAATFFFSAIGQSLAQGTLDVSELNGAMEDALTEGRDAGKDLACTAVLVFFASDFMKFIAGGAVLITVVLALYSWFAQQRGGPGIGRVFIVLAVFIAFIALTGVLISSFMGC